MANASSKVVDFTNVKDGGNFNKQRVPAGDYLAVITKVADAKSKSDDVFQYLFTIKLKKHSQTGYPYYCKLQENQLWKLRNLIIAAGISVPKKKMKFDPAKVLGKTIGVTMEDDEYEGKQQSTVAAIFPAAEIMDGADDDDTDDGYAADDNDDDEEDEPTAADIDDDEEEAEEEAEEDEADEGDAFDSMDRTELKKFLKAQDGSFQAKKSQTDDDLRELARAAGGEADEDEDEEEEPEPPKKAKKAPAKKSKAKKKPADDVDDDELEGMDIDDL